MATDEPASEPQNNFPVLIAEDDPVCRMLLSSIFKGMNHRVITVNDGKEAWDAIQEMKEPVMCILDWHMPGMDGPEICKQLSSLSKSKNVYIILLTGRTDQESMIKGLEAGAHDYITKPFDRDELTARAKVGMRVLSLQQALANRIQELEVMLGRVNQLQGLLPICSYCKSVRTDRDYWEKLEQYFVTHSDLRFSHGICPQCYEKVVEPQIDTLKRSMDSPK